jgi:phosphoesterase RecJ-like protein
MNKELTAKKIYQAIVSAKKVLLVTHYSPDGDAVASLSAMMSIMEALGKDYLAWCADKIEARFLWLPHLAKVSSADLGDNLAGADLIITLDCGTLSRTHLATKIKARASWQIVAEIDHHQPMEAEADLILRRPEAASTTEVIFAWLKINNLPINNDVAQAILTGVATDTGNFMYSSTSERSLAIASEMLNKGVSWSRVTSLSKPQYSLEAVKLWGLALSRLKINQRYQIAFTVLTLADVADMALAETMVEELPGWLSRLSDVKAVLLLKELPGNIIKGSWRACQDGVDVAKLANYLGGGGHIKASGFQLSGKLKQTANSWIIT